MNWQKRWFDVWWSSLGLLVLWPAFLVIALSIKLEDGGPVFFRQTRIGYGGHPFQMLKFRTMVVDAERIGSQITVGKDPRITAVGAWLRKTKVDELPQLLNVVRGEMSLVGPRPEVARYVTLYTPEQKRVLELTPGITDPASIRYRNESDLLAGVTDPECYYREVIMPDKIAINLSYNQKATLWTDLLVILETVLGRG